MSTNTSLAKAQNTSELTVRQEYIIPVAAFTASGNIERLKPAFVEALEAGLTVNEIKEITIQMYAYAGFPRSLNAINAFSEVMQKRKAAGIQDEIGKSASPLPADIDKNAYGHQVRNELVGRDLSNRTSGYAVFTPVIDVFLVEHLFADIFARDILDYQDRELATISALAAMDGTEAQLNTHLNVSLNVGLSKEQLKDFTVVLKTKVSPEAADKANKLLEQIFNETKRKE